MLIGYARISIVEQTLALQEDALKRAGCEQLYTHVASGARADRSGLEQALSDIRAGDTLVVWRLDRSGRSLRHLIDTIAELEQKDIGFKSLQESIDTTSFGGKLVFHFFGALAEFEHDLIRERTRAGLTAARARGRTRGRPKAAVLADPYRLKMAKKLYEEKQTPVATIAAMLKVIRSTFYSWPAAASLIADRRAGTDGRWRARRVVRP